MAERECVNCHEPFLVTARNKKRCPDCAGEPYQRDLVDELNRSEAGRLARGLRQMNNAGR